ncbi:hypothetical protein BX600DRAFT_387748 [Xylariales sp. PMI_506]|nr:hypothetical protein BX600DRAFT_387748 [Xylariales sp. PMI_506]
MSTVQADMPFLKTEPADVPAGTDPFEITAKTGYLPYQLPAQRLPAAFDALTEILDMMPIKMQNGEPGLLATYELGPLIDSGKLPDLTAEIDNLKVPGTDKLDLALMTAAMRDYSFLASAYLLEPCWQHYCADPDSGYGLGRTTLPRAIAGPLVKCAEVLNIPPYLAYAASYALYNYYLVDPAQGHDEYNNLHLIRAFQHGLDPKSSEAGFILTHIFMVAKTGGLIEGAVDLLEALGTNKNEAAVTEQMALAGLEKILEAMAAIEINMETMWTNSRPKDYMSYRTFIFGITKQSMFPDGVVYEGQFNDEPQFFRGESGANDAIIPLLDHLCEIPMPPNPLTDILVEFREYRPEPHRRFLRYVRERSAEVGVRSFLTNSGSARLAFLYLRVLDHIRSFRWRHWMFVREYILKHTMHPTATGGSPIITWLPNQLGAVMDLMEGVAKGSGLWAILEEGVWTGGGAATATSSLTAGEVKHLKAMMDNVLDQRDKMRKEVAKYCQERDSGY